MFPIFETRKMKLIAKVSLVLFIIHCAGCESPAVNWKDRVKNYSGKFTQTINNFFTMNTSQFMNQYILFRSACELRILFDFGECV